LQAGKVPERDTDFCNTRQNYQNMKSNRQLIFQIVLWPVVAIVSAIAGFLIYASLTNFRPKPVEIISVSGKGLEIPVPADTNLVFYTWNIGHCGLGKQMDFFCEGGKMVRPAKEQYKNFREGVVYQLTILDRPDFLLLQEIDSLAKRSYRDNQVKRIQASFSQFSAAFAINYKVNYVPFPVFHPMGEVISGQLTFSRFRPEKTERYAYPSTYCWPKKLFMPDPCFMLTRFKVSNGKQLVLINLHNSVLNDAAEMRDKELGVLKSLILDEYIKGNYVIAGGDWNRNPVAYDSSAVAEGFKACTINPGITKDFLPKDWQWAYDPEFPTNRSVKTAYVKGQTPVAIIDFFMLSPNVELKTVSSLETGFSYSHHQPVGMIVRLK
jgi:endonuclease/exonuclease/phosphatase family metal-dependent hydrolase